MEKKCTPLCKSLWIGGAVALAVILSKEKCRRKAVSEIRRAKECTEDAISFVRENREEIFTQIRSTMNEVSTVVRGISDDVKQISETAVHLKEGSEEIMRATKEAATEIKILKKSNMDV